MRGSKMTDRLTAGTRVAFTSYGEPKTGRVLRDNGHGIVWVEVDNAGPIFRERWLHRESLTAVK